MNDELPEALDGERIDRVVALLADLSRSQVAAMISAGAVRVNGSTVTHRSQRVAAGDLVGYSVPDVRSTVARPEPDVRVTVIHEDDAVIVVDKPAGLVVHPGAGHPDGTLINGLLAHYPELESVGEPERPGIVHRLDRGTSGLLVVARTTAAHAGLVHQLQARTVLRRYEALVWGELDDPVGVIDAPVGRSRRRPTLMAVTGEGREARTRYEVLAVHDEPVTTSRLHCRLETGRTHQIRVHLSAIGHPVVGDDRYDGRRTSIRLDRPFLHAGLLAFDHPTTGEPLRFESPLPAELREVLSRCVVRA